MNREVTALPLIAPSPKQARHDRRRQERRSPLRQVLPTSAGEVERRKRFERRASRRVEVELDCEEHHGGGNRYFRVTRDLSTFGLSTRSGFPHDLGTRFSLRLYLPDGDRAPVEVQAEVVGWHTEDGGMRLAFRNPSAEAVRRIHKFVQSL